MSSLASCSNEIDLVNFAEPAMNNNAGTITKDTTVKRTGSASAKLDSTGANAVAWIAYNMTRATSGVNYPRVCMCFQSLPTTNALICRFGGDASATTSGIGVRLNSNGSIDFLRNDTGATLFSSAASAITADSATFYSIEVSLTLNASNQITNVEGRLNAVSIGTASGLTLACTALIQAGWVGAPGASKQCWLDDIKINNGSGSASNTFPGLSKVLLFLPKSDSQIGSWTGGVGGTTNLFDAVNNTPPIGTATETNLTQIEDTLNDTGNPTGTEYRGDCGSYTSNGVGASDTINSIFPMIVDGEDIATGTKTGSFGTQANPSQTYATFTFGDDVGALGTYITNWSFHSGTFVDGPTPTLSSSLILAVRKTDTGTRVASVCFLGAYVEYTPFVATDTLYSQPCNVGNNPGMLMERLKDARRSWRKRRSGLVVPDLWLPEPATI